MPIRTFSDESGVLRKIALLEREGHFPPHVIKRRRIEYFQRVHVYCPHCCKTSELRRWRFHKVYREKRDAKTGTSTRVRNAVGSCAVSCPECSTKHPVWKLSHSWYFVRAIDDYDISPSALCTDVVIEYE